MIHACITLAFFLVSEMEDEVGKREKSEWRQARLSTAKPGKRKKGGERKHVMEGVGDRWEGVWNGGCHNVKTHVPTVGRTDRHEPPGDFPVRP
jgi:hypothetical protein